MAQGKKFQKRVKAAVNKRIKRMEKKDLLDPKKQLSGKQLRKAAGALTKIELNPGINAYKRQKKSIGRQRRRDVRGLKRLGNQTTKQVGGLYDNLAADGLANVNAQAGIAGQSNAEIAANNAAALQAANQQIGSTLDATDTSLGENAAGSGARQAMIEKLAAEKLRLVGAGQNQANFANSVGAANQIAAQGQASAAASRGVAAQAAIKTTMAQRIAQERAAAREAQREAQGKVAELKAQRGPTRLKNLMDLRGGERDFANALASIRNERAAIKIDRGGLKLDRRAQRETERKNREAEEDADKDRGLTKAELKLKKQQQRWEQQHPNAGSGGSGSAGGSNPSKISKKEWKQWSAGARNLIDQEGSVPRGKKGWQQFADDLAKQEGITWSPVEREAFIRRIRKRG